jgi:dGTPase
VLELDGAGLNLTEPVRDGILGHSWRADAPVTPEASVVRFGDRIVYINHDIDDAIRAGVISARDLPDEPIRILGDTGARRIDTLVHDLVERSAAAGDVVQGEDTGAAMAALREFMFDRVYLSPEVTREREKIRLVVRTLFEHFCGHPEEIPASIPQGELARRVTDHLAGMTDRFCIAQFEALTVPASFTP